MDSKLFVFERTVKVWGSEYVQNTRITVYTHYMIIKFTVCIHYKLINSTVCAHYKVILLFAHITR